MYTALYRRYRPQTFDDLVGQPHISRVLSHAVAQGAISHAYLFCGPRGTGKTSAARILARAINCLTPTDQGEPCNQCASCTRALAGESMDLIEIDGASNRGIDEIRDLRERVRYSPAQEKYKIYIIDEVHMLTKEAFNALLKTIEEPPAHVVFIFATTEPHKLPLTVLSRCQRFDFRRIAAADIASHLLNVAAQENIALDNAAAALIATKAEGGMRDAVSLLDQCAGAFAGQKIGADEVRRLLGEVDNEFLLALLHALLRRDAPAVLESIAQLAAAGCDLRQALADLLAATRDVTLARLDTNGKADTALPDWAAQYEPADLIRLMEVFSEADNRLRYAVSPRVTLELALLRATTSMHSADAPNTASRHSITTPTRTATPTPKPTPSAKPTPVKPTPPTPAPPVKPTSPASQPPAAPKPKDPAKASAATIELDAVQQKWPEIMSLIEQKNAAAALLLADSFPARVEGRRITLEIAPQSSIFIASLLDPAQYRTMIENSVNLALRTTCTIDAYVGAERAPDPNNAPPPPDDSAAPPESLF